MNRRTFLKLCGAGIIGIFLSKLLRLFPPSDSGGETLKEARFYRPDDTLAG